MVATIQAKMSEVELKVGTMVRSVDYVKNVGRMDQTETNPMQSINLVEIGTELKLMRQNMVEEKQRREQTANEHQAMIT